MEYLSLLVVGTLKGSDNLVNIVLDDTVEFMRGEILGELWALLFGWYCDNSIEGG